MTLTLTQETLSNLATALENAKQDFTVTTQEDVNEALALASEHDKAKMKLAHKALVTYCDSTKKVSWGIKRGRKK